MDHYNNFREEFKKLSDQELINRDNNDVGKEVWITARAEFHRALRDEFKDRVVLNEELKQEMLSAI